MRLLLISDTHGDLEVINRLAAATQADAVVHAGDVGFYDDDSFGRLSDRELRLQVIHSSLPREKKDRILKSSRAGIVQAAIEHRLLGSFQSFIDARKSFDVPVFAVWGNHEDKERARAEVKAVMVKQLKQSELDTLDDPEKLGLIHWGAKRPAQPSAPPGQPRNFEALIQESGAVLLRWKVPAPGTGGRVRTYLIQRREQPPGGGKFNEWHQIGIALKKRITLTEEPRGQQLEYRIRVPRLLTRVSSFSDIDEMKEIC